MLINQFLNLECFRFVVVLIALYSFNTLSIEELYVVDNESQYAKSLFLTFLLQNTFY